ncbi:DMT family transporter [bacterium]|nr:DMT family transporter [bacterium]
MFLVVIMYALFASVFTVAKYALNYAQPIFLIGLRMFLGGIILLSYLFFTNRKKLAIKKEHIIWFVPIVFVHIYLAYVTEFWALNYLTAAKTCLLYSLTPFLAAILSYLYFSEVVTWRKLLGLTLGLAGFLPTLLSTSSAETAAGSFGFLSWPEIMMFVSVFSSAYGWTVFRRLIKDYNYSAVLINGVGMLGGGILAFITSLALETGNGIPLVTNWVELLKWVALLILVANVISYNLYGYLLKRYTATFLSFSGFLCPLMAAFFGWFFLHEAVSYEFFFTVFFVVIGLYLFYQEELRQGYIVKS